MGPVLHAHAFRDNYIWLLKDQAGTGVVVVDPGDAGPVLSILATHGLSLRAILCTHHHADHSSGIPELVRHHPAPVFGPAHEPVVGVTHPLVEGDQVTLPGFASLSVLDIPGHTAGHIAFFDDHRLFCGDTLFSAGCGRVFEGTPEQMLRSLQKLARLPETTEVYCGHEYTLANLRFGLSLEPDNVDILDYHRQVTVRRGRDQPSLPSTIGRELRVNPFLRTEESSLGDVIDERTGQKSDSAVARFATLRRWKDVFER